MWSRIKEILSNMLGMNKTIEQTLNMTPAVSNKMSEAIDRWTDMYEDNAPWIHEPDAHNPIKVVSLGLPSFIASEKARMAVIELQSEITAPTKTVEKDNPKYFAPTTDEFGNVKVSGETRTVVEEEPISPTERAEFMNDTYQRKLLPKLRTQLEYGIAKGSLIIKPYVVKSKQSEVAGASQEGAKVEDKFDVEFDFIQSDCFYPFSFDSSGNLREVAFIQTKTDKDSLYTRIEYHKFEGNSVTITNTAWRNKNASNNWNTGSAIALGEKIPLADVYEWKDIPERATIQNVDRLLFGYFKMPDANTIDPHSPLGISGFAKAETLIREADMQFSRLLWEYEGGEMAIDIDRDALRFSQENNGSATDKLQARLYRAVDLGESNTYNVFAPALRDNSMINGLNAVLMRIEDVCAMSRGTISEVASEARTATEIRVLKQRSYSSNCEIQKALENALRDVVYTMDVYCTVYNIVGDVVKSNGRIDTKKIGKYDISFTWDDSILVDVETELNKRITLMNSGVSSKKELRMWYYGETERQAQDALDRIREENMDAIEQNAIASSQMGQAMQKEKQDGKSAQKTESKSVQSAQKPEDEQEQKNKENEGES